MIAPAEWPRDLDVVRGLFREYADGLGFDLGFQGFEEELAALPGKYIPPGGQVLLARDQGEAVGIVALRPVEGRTGEIKRLYVRRSARGGRWGRRLVEALCAEACALGYTRLCLDTRPRMETAVALYTDLGFRPTEPYVFNPYDDVIYLALDL